MKTRDNNEVTPPSGKYRWLPAEVSFKENKSVSFDTYINNLHPHQHKELYGVIEEILMKFVLMFS